MRLLRFGVSAALLLSALSAQSPIAGAIYDGNGGPLLSGVVYHATNHLNVPPGQTLTVQAGAIVKFNGTQFNVDGTLLCQGTAPNPVVFTSIHDDTAGGDTNGNGNATSPGVNQWYGLAFSSTSGASSLAHTIVRYTGAGYWRGVALSSANVTLTDCTISDGGYGGLNSDGGSRPTVARCAFSAIQGQPAITGVPFDAVPGFVGNSASNCPGGNFMRIDVTTLGASTIINANNCLNTALVYANHISVPSGIGLTLNPGVILKANGVLQFNVAGTLTSNGTTANPVILTSIYDDAAGGDTNGDGNATSPGVNQWYGLNFSATAGASSLAHTTVRYTGAGYWRAIALNSANVTISDCTISSGGYGGLNSDGPSRPTVTRCAFSDIQGQPAITGVPFDAVPGFTDNTASNCSGGNFMRIDLTTLGASTVINANNCLNTALVYANHISVPTGIGLTLNQGVILKAIGVLQFNVDGTLTCNGTGANPVVLTSIYDDAAGGDTNGDGNASSAGVNQWYGLSFTANGDASALTHAIVRYAGAGYWRVISCASADITLTDCTLSDGGYGGLNSDNASRPTVTRCDITRVQGQPAVTGVPFDALPGFTDNTASNCPGGSFIRVDQTSVSSSPVIGTRNTINSTLVYANHISIPQGAGLILGSGVVLKATSTFQINVAGHLDANGPVIFTSIYDDSYGGDTNGDGNATSGGANQWYGMSFPGTATGTMDRAIVRFAGAGYWPGITSASTSVALRRCRVEFGGWDGLDLGSMQNATDLIAFANGRYGFVVRGGNSTLLRSTSAYNNNSGYYRINSWSGAIRSCVAFGNGGVGFNGFTANEVLYSCGSGIPSGAGNITADPLFENPGAGDLRLHTGSPCIDAGDPTDAPNGTDLLGFPRLLDGRLTGTQRVDMGAQEFDNCGLIIAGTTSPGSTVSVLTFSEAPIFVSVMAIGLEQPAGAPLLNFGPLFVDLGGPFFTLVWPTTGIVPFTIPSDIPTPVSIAFQLIGLANPFPRGNTSNPIVMRIQ